MHTAETGCNSAFPGGGSVAKRIPPLPSVTSDAHGPKKYCSGTSSAPGIRVTEPGGGGLGGEGGDFKCCFIHCRRVVCAVFGVRCRQNNTTPGTRLCCPLKEHARAHRPKRGACCSCCSPPRAIGVGPHAATPPRRLRPRRRPPAVASAAPRRRARPSAAPRWRAQMTAARRPPHPAHLRPRPPSGAACGRARRGRCATRSATRSDPAGWSRGRGCVAALRGAAAAAGPAAAARRQSPNPRPRPRATAAAVARRRRRPGARAARCPTDRGSRPETTAAPWPPVPVERAGRGG
eukprot:scaffold60738_cov59-Phaeocystis_antarctica.AAC.5